MNSFLEQRQGWITFFEREVYSIHATRLVQISCKFFQLHELIEFEKEKSILGGDREHLLKFEGNYSEGNYNGSKLEERK